MVEDGHAGGLTSGASLKETGKGENAKHEGSESVSLVSTNSSPLWGWRSEVSTSQEAAEKDNKKR